MAQSLHKKLTINSISNVIKFFFYIAITFLITPFIIKSVGKSSYGLWVVLLSIIGYAGVLEMGIQTAIIKLVAAYTGENNSTKLNNMISTALTFFLITGGLVALLLWFVLPHFLHYFVDDGEVLPTLRTLTVIIGFNVPVVLLNNVFSGIIYGLQLYHRKNMIDIALNLTFSLLIFIFLTKGFGLYAMALIKTVTDFIGLVAVVVLCKKAYPDLSVKLKINYTSFKELMVFGGKVFSSTTMGRIATNAEPLMISYYLSTAWTAIFSIPKRLFDYLREIIWALTTGFMPMFSDLKTRNDPQMIKKVYLQYTRYILIITMPLLAIITVYGIPFIGLWVGEEFAQKGGLLVYIFAATLFFESLQPLLWRLLIGVGKVNFFVKMSTLSSVIYIFLCLIFIPLWGITGCAISIFFVTLVCRVIYFVYSCNYFKMGMGEHFCHCKIKPIFCSALFVVILLYVKNHYGADSYHSMFIQVVVFLPLYAIISYMFSLNRHEKEFVAGKLSGLFSQARQFLWF